MSALGPEFGGAAGDIADALGDLAERDPDAFRDAGANDDGTVAEEGTVTVEVGDESYDVPVGDTGFAVEEVTESGEHVIPHVVEPSLGIDRALYTVLDHSYRTDEVDGEERAYLGLPPEVAPTTVGVFPLMDRDGLDDRAREVAAELRERGLSVAYDDSGAIGRRYRRQDEVGTPFCVTVDYATIGEAEDPEEGEPGTVTVRERDTTAQKRVPIEELGETLEALRDGELAFADL